jgi:hypothetical protein
VNCAQGRVPSSTRNWAHEGERHRVCVRRRRAWRLILRLRRRCPKGCNSTRERRHYVRRSQRTRSSRRRECRGSRAKRELIRGAARYEKLVRRSRKARIHPRAAALGQAPIAEERDARGRRVSVVRCGRPAASIRHGGIADGRTTAKRRARPGELRRQTTSARLRASERRKPAKPRRVSDRKANVGA